eukprot:TRINITY_DN1637_c0_g1_i2.p1 TRINITY_DN1637_c0_g1~~TRINITY_DN1637_c0_g1_i2.p1  ORF type:complete len:199 (+),score=8.03 TRINITY_DN1637_c0_g1_i2:199-795(+)
MNINSQIDEAVMLITKSDQKLLRQLHHHQYSPVIRSLIDDIVSHQLDLSSTWASSLHNTVNSGNNTLGLTLSTDQILPHSQYLSNNSVNPHLNMNYSLRFQSYPQSETLLPQTHLVSHPTMPSNQYLSTQQLLQHDPELSSIIQRSAQTSNIYQQDPLLRETLGPMQPNSYQHLGQLQTTQQTTVHQYHQLPQHKNSS